jgi:23S rRNA pseudouridine955/2504/2580 synthase
VVQHIIEAKLGPKSSPSSSDQKTPQTAVKPSAYCVAIDEGSNGQRLDNFLLKQLKGVPKTHVYQVIRSGQVRVNKGRAQADTRLMLGDLVRVPPTRVAATQATPLAPAKEFSVVFEDDCLLAINKPAGVAVHGGSGVSFGVIEQLRQARPQAKFLELVHRLDRETSGLLLIAKKRAALVNLQNQWRHRNIGKTYVALVVGAWPAHCKIIDVPLHKFLTPEGERRVRTSHAEQAGAQRSISLVKIAQQFAAFTLLDVTIKTGRTHQIRVHLAHEGHAIVGDEKYGNFAFNRSLAKGQVVSGQRFERMFLHARYLRFEHPTTHEMVVLEANLPDTCLAFLAHLAP